MKKLLILIIGMAMASAAAIADDEEDKQGSGDRMAQMQENLSLSDQQVAQIRQIRDNGGGRDEILAVLTDDQLAIMKKRQAETKGRGRKGRRRAPVEDVQDSETPIADLFQMAMVIRAQMRQPVGGSAISVFTPIFDRWLSRVSGSFVSFMSLVPGYLPPPK